MQSRSNSSDDCVAVTKGLQGMVMKNSETKRRTNVTHRPLEHEDREVRANRLLVFVVPPTDNFAVDPVCCFFELFFGPVVTAIAVGSCRSFS